MELLQIITVIIVSIISATMDTLDNQYSSSIFKNLPESYFNPNKSWVNKWKDGDRNKGEKFFGSSTIFSFTTDFWHLLKSIAILTLSIGLSFKYEPLWSSYDIYVTPIIYLILYFCIFEISLRILKNNKND